MPLCAVTHYCGGLADPPNGTDLDKRSILSARPGDVCVVYRDHSASAVLLHVFVLYLYQFEAILWGEAVNAIFQGRPGRGNPSRELPLLAEARLRGVKFDLSRLVR